MFKKRINIVVSVTNWGFHECLLVGMTLSFHVCDLSTQLGMYQNYLNNALELIEKES